MFQGDQRGILGIRKLTGFRKNIAEAFCQTSMIEQGHSFIFPANEVEVTKKVLLAELYQYLEILTKRQCPAGENQRFKTCRCLETNSKQTKLLKGIHLKQIFFRKPFIVLVRLGSKYAFENVVTKTDNNHKRQQTSTNNDKPLKNDRKRPQTTNTRPQATTNHQQMTTDYQKTITNNQYATTNSHSCTSSQKSGVSFLLPALLITRVSLILTNIFFSAK